MPLNLNEVHNISLCIDGNSITLILFCQINLLTSAHWGQAGFPDEWPCAHDKLLSRQNVYCRCYSHIPSLCELPWCVSNTLFLDQMLAKEQNNSEFITHYEEKEICKQQPLVNTALRKKEPIIRYMLSSSSLLCGKETSTTDWLGWHIRLECYLLRKQPYCAFQYIWEKGFLAVRLRINPHKTYLSSGNTKELIAKTSLFNCAITSTLLKYLHTLFLCEKQYCWLEIRTVL